VGAVCPARDILAEVLFAHRARMQSESVIHKRLKVGKKNTVVKMSELEQLKQELFAIYDEWSHEAEQLKDRGSKRMGRAREQDAMRIEETAVSIDINQQTLKEDLTELIERWEDSQYYSGEHYNEYRADEIDGLIVAAEELQKLLDEYE
jgi:hypothetical protein